MNDSDRIVSSESEELILVDDGDNEIGFASKADCHDGEGALHRAFSVFLFNPQGELLLQRRAAGKRLWPGYWSNSCCSHPRRGETLIEATRRRLNDELNLDAELEFVYHFSYQAVFGDAGAEHELCHVFLGRVDGAVDYNRSEIDAVRFVSTDELARGLEGDASVYTPWLKLEWQELNERFAERLAAYTRVQPT